MAKGKQFFKVRMATLLGVSLTVGLGKKTISFKAFLTLRLDSNNFNWCHLTGV